jgi:hypothetical protein
MNPNSQPTRGVNEINALDQSALNAHIFLISNGIQEIWASIDILLKGNLAVLSNLEKMVEYTNHESAHIRKRAVDRIESFLIKNRNNHQSRKPNVWPLVDLQYFNVLKNIQDVNLLDFFLNEMHVGSREQLNFIINLLYHPEQEIIDDAAQILINIIDKTNYGIFKLVLDFKLDDDAKTTVLLALSSNMNENIRVHALKRCNPDIEGQKKILEIFFESPTSKEILDAILTGWSNGDRFKAQNKVEEAWDKYPDLMDEIIDDHTARSFLDNTPPIA